MPLFSLRSRVKRLKKLQMQWGTAANSLPERYRFLSLGALGFPGMLESLFCERLSSVRDGDHSESSGRLVSWLLERLSILRLGRHKRQLGMVANSFSCRSSRLSC